MSQKSQGGLPRYASAKEFLRIANSPVLNSENADDFDNMRRALEYEINPQGIIEQYYVSDIAAIVWDLLRFHRHKKMLFNEEINSQLYQSLRDECIEQTGPKPHVPEAEPESIQLTMEEYKSPKCAEIIADKKAKWDQDTENRNQRKKEREKAMESEFQWEQIIEQKSQKLSKLAREYFSDAAAKQKISKLLDGFEVNEWEVETSAFSELAEQLQALDRIIAALEIRRDKALVVIAFYRKSFAAKIKNSSDRMISDEAADLPHLARPTKSAA